MAGSMVGFLDFESHRKSIVFRLERCFLMVFRFNQIAYFDYLEADFTGPSDFQINYFDSGLFKTSCCG